MIRMSSCYVGCAVSSVRNERNDFSLFLFLQYGNKGWIGLDWIGSTELKQTSQVTVNEIEDCG
jgi:hypothetical protein